MHMIAYIPLNQLRTHGTWSGETNTKHEETRVYALVMISPSQ